MEFVFIAVLVSTTWASYTEEDAKVFMAQISKKSQELGSISSYKSWGYDTSFTEKASKESEEAENNYTDYHEKTVSEIQKYPWKTFKDQYLKRQFYIESFPDDAALSKEKRTTLIQLNNKMNDIYSTARVKEYKSSEGKATLLIDDVADKFYSNYMNVEEMAFYWKEWHDTVGRPEKSLFSQWIDLNNEIAVLNNYTNYAEYWHKDFETENFEETIAQLYQEMEPLFKELHAYIRYKLWIAHGKNSEIIDLNGPIPASLLGNMWGLDAINIYNITAPYPDKPPLDISPQLEAKNYTGLKMAKTAEQFYKSLNFDGMTKSFWEYSIFERKSGEMDCSPIAFNFFNGYDYRIKFCTKPIQDHFGRMFHEMGHIVNYMTWKDLPYFFQDAPNPGFGEALGDLMYLYATSPNYLKTLDLIDSSIQLDEQQEINALFSQALAVVFFLPYAYSLDMWRWGVMKGKITPENYNCEYWKTRIELQGVEPPVERNETDFDPGAKLHIVTGYQYISYFVSEILVYQFQKELCTTAGQYDPNQPLKKSLVFCDIYNSKEAGAKLKKMMALGRSRPWPDVLEVITGKRKMDTSPLLEFYQPLYKWLQEENKKNGVTVGWNSGHNKCRRAKGSTSGCRKRKII